MDGCQLILTTWSVSLYVNGLDVPFSIRYYDTNTLEYVCRHSQPIGMLIFACVVNHSSAYLMLIVIAVIALRKHSFSKRSPFDLA